MKKKIKEIREFLVEDVSVTPVEKANALGSRMRYSLKFRGKQLPGLWELDAVDALKQTMTYKKVKEVI